LHIINGLFFWLLHATLTFCGGLAVVLQNRPMRDALYCGSAIAKKAKERGRCFDGWGTAPDAPEELDGAFGWRRVRNRNTVVVDTPLGCYL
jgi:hypothetical protein